MLNTMDMFACARCQFPEFPWEYREGNEIIAKAIPVSHDAGWSQGSWCCSFNNDGYIISVEVKYLNTEEVYETEEECLQAMQEMPF